MKTKSTIKNQNKPARHLVIFAGAGPGDPELITVKGQLALADADLVIYAGSLVPEAVLKWTKPKTRVLNSASMHLEEIIDEIEKAYKKGKHVVRLHTGDPSLYGAIFEQMANLDKKSIPYKVIPGVTAAFAAAAAMGIEYTLPEVSQTLILTRMAGRTPVPENEALESLAGHKASMAIYLSISMVDKVARVLEKAYGKHATCAVVYCVSQPEEKIIFTSPVELPEIVRKEKITRQVLIIIGKALDISKHKKKYKSKLYDKNFSHGFRKKKNDKIALWAITPKSALLARKIAESLPDAKLHLSADLNIDDISASYFERLSDAIASNFHAYTGHVFIMSTGIVVRLIASCIRSKTTDPAVVVVDEIGRHAVSLLSGHLGGANSFAIKVAGLIGAEPVITTATDVNQVPAIDVLAKHHNLFIENPEAIKNINMAFITGKKFYLHDPYKLLRNNISPSHIFTDSKKEQITENEDTPGVFIDDALADFSKNMLILRPGSLVAGIGCNRNTTMKEIKKFFKEVLEESKLAIASVIRIATINLKADELGLIAFAEELKLPISFYDKEELNQADGIKSPSDMVEKHTGVKSVCEAAAILASKNGELIVPKHSTRNVTVAIARIPFIS
ncbi:MAG: precorrin-4 C(11)-methyltransferase [Deltaproteobacteria bacterium]|nr:precorrin-4 C(11)-methyltransferase [Deltaproteobacteria bacterium]MBW1833462.1 precorrin-4 C(11)-methyltransferase [Deltaproteobacteria bacterium]MBW2164888.1 precorrin-4 C(11)-methyltransferase [Deltaproteobacteria bacterium]